MVICLEQGPDLHMAQLMPLPLTVSCFSKIQIGFTFLVPAHRGSPGQRAVKWVCVCVWAELLEDWYEHDHELTSFLGMEGGSGSSGRGGGGVGGRKARSSQLSLRSTARDLWSPRNSGDKVSLPSSSALMVLAAAGFWSAIHSIPACWGLLQVTCTAFGGVA